MKSPEGTLSIVVVKLDGKYAVEFPSTVYLYKTKDSYAFSMVNKEGVRKDVHPGLFDDAQVSKTVLEVANLGFALVPGLEESAKQRLMTAM